MEPGIDNVRRVSGADSFRLLSIKRRSSRSAVFLLTVGALCASRYEPKFDSSKIATAVS